MWRRAVCAACVAVVGASCAESRLHEVTGRITLDGVPLADAVVTYISDDDLRHFFLGRTDGEGHYRLQADGTRSGVSTGRYVVRVTTYRDADDRSEPPVPGIAERVPKRYNLESELRAEIVPGMNERSYDLHTEEPR